MTRSALIWAVSAALAAAVFPSVGQACSPTPFDPDVAQLLDRDPAIRMFAAAANVDVVEVERTDPLDAGAWVDSWRDRALASLRPTQDRVAYAKGFDDWKASILADRPSRITFRIVERLKGSGSDTFQLSGFVIDLPLRPVAVTGYSADALWHQSVVELTPDAALAIECGRVLQVRRDGGLYLVFRNAQGGLLGDTVRWRWTRSREMFDSQGFVFEPVDDANPWLRRVRRLARAATRR